MPDPRKRIPMIVVGNDPDVRALTALLSDTIVCVGTIAEARTLLLRGDNFLKGDEHTVVAYTPDFVASFNDEAPEVAGGLPRTWKCIVLAATLGQPAGGWPFTDVALNRLGLGRKDVVSFPVDKDRLDAYLATKAGGA